MKGVFWKNPNHDHTIPSTDEEINACLDKLVTAIMNNKNCREKNNTKQFNNRWGISATHYAKEELYMAAYEVLTAIINIHRHGWTKPIFDQEQRNLFQKTMYYTFAERFDGVKELLKVSKTSCNDIMKGERLYSIIGNPVTLIIRTRSNQSSNTNKAKRIKMATEMEMKTRKRKHDQVDEVKDGQMPSDKAARPKKAARRTRRTAVAEAKVDADTDTDAPATPTT